MTPKPAAIIIGAGLAGLATALRLGEGRQYEPVLLEREPEPGGLARSLHLSGLTTDLGPHRIHTVLPEVRRLIERLTAPGLLRVARTSHIYLRGKFLSYPPAPLEMALHLGPLRMARFMAGFAAGRLSPAPAEETYESLMRRAFGRPLYEFLLRPYSAKTWKIDPAELHADTARVRVSAGSLAKMVSRLLRGEREGEETSLKQFHYVRGGAEALVRHFCDEARAAGARLELGRSVAALELDETGRVRAALGAPAPSGGAPERHAGELFISTAPLPRLLGELLPERPWLAEAREAAAGLRYLDMILVFLIVRRGALSRDQWLYFPEPHLIFNRGYEAKNFDPSLGPADRTILCLEITLRRGDALGRESDEALVKTATRQIASTGLLAEREVERGVVYRLPYAYPLYTLDYAERLRRALEGLRRIPNLITSGRQGLFNHNNMDHSIYMGLRAADLLNSLPAAEAVARWWDDADHFKTLRIVD